MADKKGRVAKWIADKLEHDEIVNQLYLSTLCRFPTEEEMEYSREVLKASPSPDEGLERLKEGNKHFVASSLTSRDWKAQLEASAGGANPFAAVITTCDPRIPLPLVFDADIGDIFAVRTPGPVASRDVVDALEIAAETSGVKVIVVLTHSDCAAVAAACEGSDSEHMRDAIAAIAPSVAATPRDAGDRLIDGISFEDSVAVEHASRTAESLRASSDVLRTLEQEGRVRIVAAYYDVPTGAIVWL